MEEKIEEKRILIIGAGSIGLRHAAYLKALGCNNTLSG